MKRTLTGVLVFLLLISLTLPVLSAPAARTAHPIDTVVELEGVYQVVKKTKSAPAYAVLKLFAPIDIVLTGGAGIAAQVGELQVPGTIDPSLKGKNVRAKGQLAAASDASFRRPFVLNAPTFIKLPKPTSVTLNEKQVALSKGDQFPLRAIVLPDGAKQIVSFSSSKKSVARVTPEGVIVAVGKGSATITATAVGGKKATVKVDVVIPVTEVGVGYGYVELCKIGEKSPLQAWVLPRNASNKTIIFTTSNPAVATVTKKGVIKAVGEGHATITVASHDGRYSNECEVVVVLKDDPVPVTGVTISKTTLDLHIGERTKLSAAIAPDNAVNRMINWESDNRNVAEVDHTGWVTALSAGTATITVETNEGVFKSSCVVTVINPSKYPHGNLSTTGQISSRNLLVQQTEQLTLVTSSTSTPPPPVKQWVSLSPTVASVNPFTGVVTGRAPGIALVYPDTGYLAYNGAPAASPIPVIVSKAALPVIPMTASDFAVKISGKPVGFSSTLDQVKAQFPGGIETVVGITNDIRYEFDGVCAYFQASTKQLIMIILDSSRASTQRGVAPGQPFTKLVKQYGLPDESNGALFSNGEAAAFVAYSLGTSSAPIATMSVEIDPPTQTVRSLTLVRTGAIPE